jgi:D-sedoheptulose 7-phosphate isomerase
MLQTEPIATARTHSSADYMRRLSALLALVDSDDIDEGVHMVRCAWENGRQIITLGNGGSAITALHYITDWNKAAYLAKRRSFRGRTLVDNIGLLTAYSNDISYERVFLEQLANVAERGDLVVAVSGSGNSANVLRAVDFANGMACPTLGLCGFSGGELRKRAVHAIWAPIDDMQLCEDVHAVFGHIVMQALIS